jgi:hypothetical protein
MTWLVPPDERTAEGRLPVPWASCLWDGGGDPDVMATALLALHQYDPERFAQTVERGVDFLEREQRPGGAWPSPCYGGRYYAIRAGLRLFGATRPTSRAVARARGALLDTQRPDGAWGKSKQPGDPLSTALAVLGLAEVPAPAVDRDPVRRAIEFLAATQQEDGGWPAVGLYWRLEEAGTPPEMTQFASRALTTGLVVEAILTWRRLTA